MFIHSLLFSMFCYLQVLFEGEKHGRHMNRDLYKVPMENADQILPLNNTTTNDHFITSLCRIATVVKERRKRSRSSHGDEAVRTTKRMRMDQVSIMNAPEQPAVASIPYGNADVQQII